MTMKIGMLTVVNEYSADPGTLARKALSTVTADLAASARQNETHQVRFEVVLDRTAQRCIPLSAIV